MEESSRVGETKVSLDVEIGTEQIDAGLGPKTRIMRQRVGVDVRIKDDRDKYTRSNDRNGWLQ